MPALAEVISLMQTWYDPAGAEAWDAVGLTCGDPAGQVDRVLLAIDAVPDTVADAENRGAQLLLTHHPLLLTAVHGVPADQPKGALVHRMIRGGIAHFVAHTNAEVGRAGVSDALADALGLLDVRPLPGGVGRIGRLPQASVLRTFAGLVAAGLPPTAGGVRASGDPGRRIERVAVLAGSGSSLLDQARQAGADVMVTADLRHHNAVEAVTQRDPGAMALVDAAHWATEVPWLHAFARRLREHFGDTVDFTVSDTVTDPWSLHVPSQNGGPRPPW